MKEIKGIEECFVCGTTIEWEYVPSPRKNQIIVYEVSGAKPDITAIGKEDGKTKIEVVCTCPSCKIKNKYIKLV